jgi:hypothetical protein
LAPHPYDHVAFSVLLLSIAIMLQGAI